MRCICLSVKVQYVLMRHYRGTLKADLICTGPSPSSRRAYLARKPPSWEAGRGTLPAQRCPFGPLKLSLFVCQRRKVVTQRARLQLQLIALSCFVPCSYVVLCCHIACKYCTAVFRCLFCIMEPQGYIPLHFQPNLIVHFASRLRTCVATTLCKDISDGRQK